MRSAIKLLWVISSAQVMSDGFWSPSALRPQVFRITPPRRSHDCIGCFENRHYASVVLFECDGRGAWELFGKAENVFHRRAPETVNRLGIVADNHDRAAGRRRCLLDGPAGRASHQGPHSLEDRCLHRVGVLILVHEHVLKAIGDRFPRARHAQGLLPIKKKIVVIEQVSLSFSLAIFLEDALDVVLALLAPGKPLGQHFFERVAGVDAGRVDCQKRPLLGKTSLRAVQVEVRANEVEQILGVTLVENDKLLVQAELPGVDPKQPVGDAMKRAAPDASGRGFADDLAGAAQHFRRGTAREGEQENAAGVCAPLKECRHAGCQGLSLACPRARDYEERPGKVLGRRPLLRVQNGEMVESFRRMDFARHRDL